MEQIKEKNFFNGTEPPLGNPPTPRTTPFSREELENLIKGLSGGAWVEEPLSTPNQGHPQEPSGAPPAARNLSMMSYEELENVLKAIIRRLC